jgi:hypothetical protein
VTSSGKLDAKEGFHFFMSKNEQLFEGGFVMGNGVALIFECPLIRETN